MSNSPREDGFIKIDDFVFAFEREELSEEMKQLAARELRETPEVREEALRTFKDLIKEENNLFYPPHRDDIHLIFLRATSFYPNEAMNLLRNFCRFKANHPSLYSNLVPSEVAKPFLAGLVGGLPKRDREGRRVLLVNSGALWNPSYCNVYELIRGVIIMVTIASLEPKTQVLGGVAIFDMQGMTLSHVIQFSPRLAHSILTMVQECMPIHLHAVHIINQPYIYDMLYAIFKPFMSQKLRNMLHFHGADRERLIEHIGAKTLPVQYGGQMEMPEVPGSAIHELLCYYEEEYKDLLQYGYIKTAKPKKEDILQNID